MESLDRIINGLTAFRNAIGGPEESSRKGQHRTSDGFETTDALRRNAPKARDTGIRLWKTSDNIQRFAAIAVLVWYGALIFFAFLPIEAMKQVLIVVPFFVIGMAFFSEPTAITAAFAWSKTKSKAQRLITTAAFMEVVALAIWFIPLHARRSLILPFAAVVGTIGLFKLGGYRGKVVTVLWIGAAAMALTFFIADVGSKESADTVATQTTEPERDQFLGYTTTSRESSTTSAAPPATSSPAVHEAPVQEANIALREDVSPDIAEAGTLVHSTVVVENHSQVTARNVTITVELPHGLQFANTGLRVREEKLGDIPSNGEVSISSTILVEENISAGGYDSVIRVNADNHPDYSVPQSLMVSEF